VGTGWVPTRIAWNVLSKKNVIEPRMNTDETRINNSLSGNCAYTIQVSLASHVTHRFICVNPCSSVANKCVGWVERSDTHHFQH